MQQKTEIFKEWILAIPPGFVFLTSVMGTIPWQPIMYFLSCIWLLVQMYYKIKKEQRKIKMSEPDTGPAPL